MPEQELRQFAELMKKYIELDALSLNEDAFVELGLRTVEACTIPTKNVMLVGRKNADRKPVKNSEHSFKVASSHQPTVSKKSQMIAEKAARKPLYPQVSYSTSVTDSIKTDKKPKTLSSKKQDAVEQERTAV